MPNNNSTPAPSGSTAAKADILWRFFFGREDVYPLQKANGAYFPKEQPLTKEILLRHCKGHLTVGVYPIRKDGMVTLGALDFDAKDSADFDIKRPRMREAVLFANRWLAHFNVPSHIEFSGRKGYHLWVLLKNPAPAAKVRRILSYLANQVTDELGDLGFKIECFPKQDVVSKTGNLIKLPFGKHRVSGLFTYFTDERFERLPDDGLVSLEASDAVAEELLDDIIAEFPEPQKEALPKTRVERSEDFNALAVAKLLESCAFMRHCRDDATTLAEPDWWGMIHQLAPFGEAGEREAHRLSQPYPQYTEEETQQKIDAAKKALEGGIGPHTCKTIRDELQFVCPEYCIAHALDVASPAGLASRLASHELVQSRTASAQISVTARGEKIRVNCPLLADEIMKNHIFNTFRDSEEVLIYEDGFYRPNGESRIKEQVRDRLLHLTSTYRVNEVINYIRISTYANRADFNQDQYVLNLENGLLDTRTLELKPHTPGFLSTIRIPVKYNPTASCPRISTFLGEILLPDDVPIIEELIGYCLEPSYHIHRAFLFSGDGANGKSTLIELIRAFLGKENCATTPLQAFDTNRFSTASLFGKLASLYADIPSTVIRHVGTFKMLTGGDTVHGEKKFQNPFSFSNYAKLVFSTNKPPRIQGEDSLAFWRRWIIINFPHQFMGSAADKGILKKLTKNDELSGLLNVALKGLERLRQNEDFTYAASPDEVAELYLKASDPIHAFLTEVCVITPEHWTSKDELYQAYKAFSLAHKLPTMGKESFGRALKNSVIASGISPDRRRIQGQLTYGWRGVGLGDLEEPEDVDDLSF